MPVTITNHGGSYSCCGCSHLSRFTGAPSREAFHQTIVNRIARVQGAQQNRARAPQGIDNHLFEAALTDAQMQAGWDVVLKDYGFRLVTRFYNSNTGNYVNILHYSPTRASRRNADVPFNWPGPNRRA